MIFLRPRLAMLVLSSLASAGSLRAQAGKRPPNAAQIAAAPAQPIEDRAALVRLENGWTTALTKRDRSYFERVLDPDFIYTENERIMSRAQVLSDLMTGSDVVTSAGNDDMVVHLFGSTAVVTGLLHASGKSGNRPFLRRYRFTDTWVRKSDGSWRIVAAQDYLLPSRP